MKNPPMFSILIPVYNTSEYLRQCLDSILIQEVNDYEVIIVNDGSTDNSLEICKEYANKDSRIFVIEQENKGLLLTRRVAIRESRGEYLLFLDSDDYWEQNTLKSITKIIERFQRPDIIMFNYNLVDNYGKLIKKSTRSLPYDNLIKKEEYNQNIIKILVSTDNLNTLWAKAVKRDIVDVDSDYSSYSRLSHGEDLLQSLPLIFNSKNIIFTNYFLYNYRSNPQSITNNFSLKSFRDITKVRARLLDVLRTNNLLTEEIHNLFNNRNFYIILSIINLVSISKRKYKEKRKFLMSIIKDPFLNDIRLNYKRVKLTKRTLFPKMLLELMTIRAILPIVILFKLRYLFVSTKK